MKWTYLALVAVAVMLVTGSMSLAADATKGAGTVNGSITKVEKESIEISVRSRDKGATPETKTLALTKDTKVMVEKAPGAAGERPKAEAGTTEDLKVGKRVSVKCSDDGKTALEITVRLAGGRRGGGDKAPK
jgi:hypothetical protein